MTMAAIPGRDRQRLDVVPRCRPGSATTTVLLCVLSALAMTACGASNAPSARTGGAASQGAPGGSGLASAAATASTVVAGGRSPSGGDQCAYLTTPEIEAATGLKVVGSGPDPFGISSCVWTLSGEGRNQIGLSVDLDSTRATKDQEFSCTVGFGLKPIEGLGDTACGDTVTGGEYELDALQGNDRLRLEVSADLNYENSIKKSAWATLARAVLAKLG